MATLVDKGTYEFINENDLKEILGDASSILLKDLDYEQMPMIKKIETLCKSATLNIASTDSAQQKLGYKLGMMVVFSLREFLLQESLIFSIGATSPSSKNALLNANTPVKLSIKEITLKDMFINTFANLKSKSIELSYELEKFDENNLSDLSNLWNNIVNAASFEWEKGSNYNKKQYITSRGKTTWIYQKPDIDSNVYVRYYERQKRKYLTFYYKNSDKYTNYNAGWLYEWMLEYINEREENLTNLLDNFNSHNMTPLENMMSGKYKENIEGYKGGDFKIDAMQVQAKLGNRRIITFTSINKVLKNIQSIISEYQININNSNAKNNMANKFLALFTHEDTYILNKNYNEVINNMITNIF